MIYSTEINRYGADAWSYGLKKSTAAIRAFFRIYKGEVNKLISISETHTAKLVADQSYLITGFHLPDIEICELFSRIALFSRIVPGYDLHYRKTIDFWELIDNEINND